MPAAVAPPTPGRASRRWWYALALGMILLIVLVCSVAAYRWHASTTAGAGTTVTRQHAAERSRGTNHPGESERTRERATATPGA